MRTIHITVYTFDELDEAAQKRAIDNCRHIHFDGIDWWDEVYEDAHMVGIEIKEFDSQPWRSSGNFLYPAKEVAEAIVSLHGEHCTTYKIASDFLNQYEQIWGAFPEVFDENGCDGNLEIREEAIKEWENRFKLAIFGRYAEILEEEELYLLSDDAVKHEILGRGIMFTQQGNVFTTPK